MIIVPAGETGVRQAAEAIRQGGVVAYPTETVYGLGADPFSVEAIQRLFEIKGRDFANPIPLIVASREQLREVAEGVSPAAEACMRAFWPGPLSLLLPKSARLPESLIAGHAQVCVRETSHPVARALCIAVGYAITSTSANRAGQPPARSVAELDLPDVELVLDAGLLPPSPPSTVFDPDTNALLRAGAIPEESIRDALKGNSIRP